MCVYCQLCSWCVQRIDDQIYIFNVYVVARCVVVVVASCVRVWAVCCIARTSPPHPSPPTRRKGPFTNGCRNRPVPWFSLGSPKVLLPSTHIPSPFTTQHNTHKRREREREKGEVKAIKNPRRPVNRPALGVSTPSHTQLDSRRLSYEKKKKQFVISIFSSAAHLCLILHSQKF